MSLPELNPQSILAESPLDSRHPQERFSALEKVQLTQLVRRAWTGLEVEFPNPRTLQASLADQFEIATFGDGEIQILLTPEGQDLQKLPDPVYFYTDFESPQDVETANRALFFLEHPNILVAPAFPSERSDRPAAMRNGQEEQPTTDYLLALLSALGQVKGIITTDVHSPAFSWYALKHDIAVLDVTSLPMQVAKARELELLHGPLTAVACDDGARELALLTQSLTCADHFLQGDKTKVNGCTSVCFPEAELAQVSGTTAVIPEDIIGSGGTLSAVINQLLEAGARQVVVMASFSIFCKDAFDKMDRHRDHLTIITTNGRTPQDPRVSEADFIHAVPMREQLFQVAQENRRDPTDWWTLESEARLLRQGFCLSPWQTYALAS